VLLYPPIISIWFVAKCEKRKAENQGKSLNISQIEKEERLSDYEEGHEWNTYLETQYDILVILH
jgi:hypothetical protein